MKIEVMARTGHELLAEIGGDTSTEELRRISLEFNEFQRRGFRAFTRHGQRVDSFDPNLGTDIILVAPLIGG